MCAPILSDSSSLGTIKIILFIDKDSILRYCGNVKGFTKTSIL